MTTPSRCPWPANDPQMLAYHDTEWGEPCFEDRKLFEMLVLETAQAGLSWRVVLHKRAGYRRLLHDFDPTRVAAMQDAEITAALTDPGIIRNQAKLRATVGNAQVFLRLAEQHGSFAAWQWRFTQGQSVRSAWREMRDVPATTPLSDRIAAELKREGMKFMGSTVVYAHLQATGVVQDHLVSCFRWTAP